MDRCPDFPFLMERCLSWAGREASTVERLRIYYHFTMLTMQSLADIYGLSYKQVRDRLTALGPLIDPCIVEGKNNAKLLNDSGRAIFDRLRQLEGQGHTIGSAVDEINQELQANGAVVSNGMSTESEMEKTIARLKDELERLRMKVEEHDVDVTELWTQVQLMLPDGSELAVSRADQEEAQSVETGNGHTESHAPWHRFTQFVRSVFGGAAIS